MRAAKAVIFVSPRLHYEAVSALHDSAVSEPSALPGTVSFDTPHRRVLALQKSQPKDKRYAKVNLFGLNRGVVNGINRRCQRTDGLYRYVAITQG